MNDKTVIEFAYADYQNYSDLGQHYLPHLRFADNANLGRNNFDILCSRN